MFYFMRPNDYDNLCRQKTFANFKFLFFFLFLSKQVFGTYECIKEISIISDYQTIIYHHRHIIIMLVYLVYLLNLHNMIDCLRHH